MKLANIWVLHKQTQSCSWQVALMKDSLPCRNYKMSYKYSRITNKPLFKYLNSSRVYSKGKVLILGLTRPIKQLSPPNLMRSAPNSIKSTFRWRSMEPSPNKGSWSNHWCKHLSRVLRGIHLPPPEVNYLSHVAPKGSKNGSIRSWFLISNSRGSKQHLNWTRCCKHTGSKSKTNNNCD